MKIAIEPNSGIFQVRWLEEQVRDKAIAQEEKCTRIRAGRVDNKSLSYYNKDEMLAATW